VTPACSASRNEAHHGRRNRRLIVAGGDQGAFEAQLKPFVEHAARAARGESFLFISHSSIDPPDFASTTECSHYLIAALGGRPQPVRRADRFGLELVEYFRPLIRRPRSRRRQ
jgi:hypothetical protein